MTDLEASLVDLGAHLDVPAAPDLPARVASAIRAGQPAPRHRRRRLAVALAALAGVAGIAVSPAVADWLGLRGVRVHQEPAPLPATAGAPLRLGRPVTPAEASSVAGFDLLVPARLGPPDETWLDATGAVPVVTLLYRAGPVLLAELRAPLDDATVVSKFVGPGATVEEVTVAGGRGLWLEGVHEVAYRDPDGRVRVDRLRLADRVLLWERGDVTLRLEADLPRDEAIRVAESVS